MLSLTSRLDSIVRQPLKNIWELPLAQRLAVRVLTDACCNERTRPSVCHISFPGFQFCFQAQLNVLLSTYKWLMTKASDSLSWPARTCQRLQICCHCLTSEPKVRPMGTGTGCGGLLLPRHSSPSSGFSTTVSPRGLLLWDMLVCTDVFIAAADSCLYLFKNGDCKVAFG